MAITDHSNNPGIAERIRYLVENQPFCVLCTQGNDQPYGSLIAFAFTDDLKHFFFITPVKTRKYQLLSGHPQAAFVIDSRVQHSDKAHDIHAVTVAGKVRHLKAGHDFEQGIALLRKRHSYMAAFIETEDDALFQFEAECFYYVERFQETQIWKPVK